MKIRINQSRLISLTIIGVYIFIYKLDLYLLYDVQQFLSYYNILYSLLLGEPNDDNNKLHIITRSYLVVDCGTYSKNKIRLFPILRSTQ